MVDAPTMATVASYTQHGAKREDDPKRIAHQMTLERLFSKNQLIPRIRNVFMADEKAKKYIEAQQIDYPFAVDLLTQMVLHKRANLSTLVGILHHHFTSLQACADALLKAAECDLVDWSSTAEQFIIKYDIPADVKEELEKFQYPLPMVVKPNMVRCNTDVGYLLNRGSIILKDNYHEDDVVLDHINRVNGFRFVINDDTAMMVKNKWRNLDKPKQGETKEEFQKRVRAFEKYDRTAHDVIALLVQEGKEFYLTHRYDKRGRVYCQGYHVNYQGAPWNKAVIELAEKELVT